MRCLNYAFYFVLLLIILGLFFEKMTHFKLCLLWLFAGVSSFTAPLNSRLPHEQINSALGMESYQPSQQPEKQPQDDDNDNEIEGQAHTRFSKFAPSQDLPADEFRSQLHENMKAEVERRRKEDPNNRGSQAAKSYLDNL